MHALAPWPGFMRVLNMMQAKSLQSAFVAFSECKHLSGFVLCVFDEESLSRSDLWTCCPIGVVHACIPGTGPELLRFH